MEDESDNRKLRSGWCKTGSGRRWLGGYRWGGIREKDRQKLVIRWLTYPSRQELPLLAESAQATLKEIGMDVQVNCTSDNNTIRKDPTLWDVYASAMVTAPTGDPPVFLYFCALDSSVSNNGHYHSR